MTGLKVPTAYYCQQDYDTVDSVKGRKLLNTTSTRIVLCGLG
jgi:hypothetical protein